MKQLLKACSVLLLAAWLPAMGAEPRVALVIGNGAYDTSPLINPPNDAQLIAATLTSLGFDVITRRDSDQIAMKRAIQEFGLKLEKAGPNAVGLFYYAGHGVQINGRNYLIPTRARIERDSDAEIEAVSADWVLEQMRYARNRLNLIILDACRNNPFARSLRSADRGLAKMDAPAGVLIAYSTAPGDVAADGSGRNSPYSDALARAMREANQPVEQVFKRTRVAVMGATSGRQTPWESSSLTGDFYFTTAGRPAVAAPPVAAATAGSANRDLEVAFWQGMQNSSNAADFESYLQQYPNGLFASLAKSRLAALKQARPPLAVATDGVCEQPVGRWKTSGNNIAVEGEVAIQADRTVAWWKSPGDKLPAVTGTWTCEAAARRFVFSWGHGSIDTLTLSADGRRLSGRNQIGIQIVQTRLR